MGADEPGWHYVGSGQLRYMDGDGWTDQYKRTSKELPHASRCALLADSLTAS